MESDALFEPPGAPGHKQCIYIHVGKIAAHIKLNKSKKNI